MASDVSDKVRLLRFIADGKQDLLLPTGFSATEQLSGLFRVQVELIATLEKASQIQAQQLLGKRMNLRVTIGPHDAEGPYRYFDGLCCRFAAVGKDFRFQYYQAELVPWLWLLTKRADCRVYQDKSVPDIVESVLKDLQQDFDKFQFEIRANRGSYKKIDYAVQFRETHFNFVSRLLEQDGLYYYFEHTEDGHKLIIDDSTTVGGDLPHEAQVRYAPESGEGSDDEDVVSAWREERLLHSGQFAARDYHAQLAQNKLDFSQIAPKTSVGNNSKLEIFEWPSGSSLRYNQTDQRLGEVNTVGSSLVNLRAQAEETTHRTIAGNSTCRAFTPGYRFSLEHNSGQKYVLTEVQHSAVQSPIYETGAAVRTPYNNSFSGIPSDVQYRPRRETPKPVVDGLQTAKVVGKSGEEIWIDKYGRVRVQFYWDRKGENNEKSTCWVRVAQLAAGKRWGTSFWPRIGQEVLVAFVEGDPDQPVIVGTVYNNQQMPPYLGDGPDSKHANDPNVSGYKSNSTKGGDGYNELRFDDTKGKEEVFLHAEKDMDVRVKNDYRQSVGPKYELTVGDKQGDGTRDTLINKDENLNVKGNRSTKIEGNELVMIGGGDGGNYHLTVEQNLTENIKQNHDSKVMGDRRAAYTGGYSLTAAKHDAKVDQNYVVEAGMTVHIKAGMTMILEAGIQLSLIVGGNFVDLNPAGVFINGTLLMLNSGGAPGAGPGAQPQSPDTAQTPSLNPPDAADDSVTGSKSCD